MGPAATLLLIAALLAPARNPKPAAPPLDPARINDAGMVEAIGPGSKGPSVVRAQVLLARAHFSCGEIDGEYGVNLQKAAGAFQTARNLPSSGNLDAPTWEALNADQAPALIPYTVTAEDVAGPFVKIPPEMKDQAKLPALGYQSPEEALGERFHASPKLLEALNPGKPLAKEGQQILVPNVLTMPPGKAAKVVVSKSQSAVMAYDGAGKLLAWYAATIGSEHDPLPIGEWKIEGVRRNPVFHYNPELFWDARSKDEKARIAAGPNNPVGVVWIDLSKEHYGIHGTPDPAKVGHVTSHGCIRLTNWDAAELAGMVQPGTPAILEE